MENYMTLAQAADKWDISARRIRTLCEQERILGATRFGRAWAIPVDSLKPEDKRVKSGKYVKQS